VNSYLGHIIPTLYDAYPAGVLCRLQMDGCTFDECGCSCHYSGSIEREEKARLLRDPEAWRKRFAPGKVVA
jgi:hypothetical protein